jgi:hypothetical protein
LACSIIGAADVDGVVQLMQRIGVHFGGSRDRRVLEAVARDGVEHPEEVVLGIGKLDGIPRALVVGLTIRSRYWKRFPMRHPLAAIALAKHRVVRRLRKAAGPAPNVDNKIAEARALLHDNISPRGRESWDDESLKIAKVMYVAVDPDARKGGAGAQMYGWYFRHLHTHSFVRCDAHVSSDNVAAVKLHKRFPFRFIEVPGGYFLWLLPSEVT